MAPEDILELNLTDLSKRIAARELSSAEAVKTALTHLDQLEGKLNAFITVLREQAPAQAKQADAEIARGNYRGPLHGVPVTIKDMFETAGVLTTGG
jgi:aspartyl-tRNA(Asn)/glutamyl-tRNA(Gln) amidotransferase subunit A